jgi:hypothetical protein
MAAATSLVLRRRLRTQATCGKSALRHSYQTSLSNALVWHGADARLVLA